jgi:hypothetical protein
MMSYDEYKVRVLTRTKFPDRYELEKPNTGDNPERLARIEAFRAFKAELEKISLEELDRRYLEHLRLQQEMTEQAARRNDEMAYFSRPEATADFAVWCALENWTIDEATALLLGKDPMKVGWSNICKIDRRSIFAATYGDLRTRLLRASQDGRFSDPDKWRKFVKWAHEIGRNLPSGLNTIPTDSISQDPEVPEGKRKSSLLKLILGMAMVQYGYEPNAAKNAATTKIVNDLTDLELKIDPQTVLTILREATESLDPKPK